VDRIKELGYSGVQLQTNVPINVNSGQIDLYDENAYEGTRDKSLPDDFWRIAAYASNLGLDVAVRAEPVDYINDAILNKWYGFGSGFSETEFFNSLVSYETALAAEAEKSGVDLFYIGALQGGFDEGRYLARWQEVIDSVRSVYSGDLAYLSHYEGYTPLWNLVDVLSINFDPLLSQAPSYDLQTIIDLYSDVETVPGRVTDVVKAIHDIAAKTDKPILLDDVRFDAGNDALGNYVDYFGMALNQVVNGQAPNVELQTLRIHAFFQMLKSQLQGVVDAIVTREYMPWMQSKWIVDAEGPFGSSFKQLSVNGFDLYNQPDAEKAYAYFIKTDDAPINGTEADDVIWIYSGNHRVDGGAGLDTAEFFNPLSYCVFESLGSEFIVTNWVDGDINLRNVERLQFSDLNLALDTAKGEIAGSAYRLYKAAFDRTPDAEGLGFWIASLDSGVNLTTAAQGFINSAEFKVMYGANATDEHFVTLLYNHVLHRAPEGAGYQFWLDSLDAGASRAQVLKDFSESTENIDQTASLIANGIQYEAWGG
uniref:DUF4214 domain-containing protein n=1 Tax=Flavobacterium sp. TaxID=239 RepID=UPI0037C0EC32